MASDINNLDDSEEDYYDDGVDDTLVSQSELHHGNYQFHNVFVFLYFIFVCTLIVVYLFDLLTFFGLSFLVLCCSF